MRTAEERVAGLLGSVLEHRQASAALRIFARIVGAPAADGGSRDVGETIVTARALLILISRLGAYNGRAILLQ